MARLIERFRAEASRLTSDPKMRKATRVHMPENLYSTLREIHRRSLEMAERILDVMADEEHEFFMAFGRARRQNLPDMDVLKGEVMLYALFLRDFDPCAILPPEKPGHVTMRAETALGMAHMLHYNNQMLSSIQQGLQKTEYMKIFTDAKLAGLIYSGKTALAEIMNLDIAIRIIGSETVPDEAAMDPGKWPVFGYRARGPGGPAN